MKLHFVLDQNYLRSDELKQRIATDLNCHFIITDDALLEMCKSPEWEKTLRGSLLALTVCPGRVHVSIAVDEAIRMEMGNWKSVSGRLLKKEFSAFLRNLLSDVQSGTSRNCISLMASKMPSAQASMQQEKLNNTDNKSGVDSLLTSLREILPKPFVKGLRNNSLSHKEQLETMVNLAPHLMMPFFQEQGLSAEKVKSFLRQKPILLRHTYLRLWLCFDWLSKGGFEGLNEDKVTNDFIDHNYVIISTFFDGILSKETRVNAAYKDIKWMLAYKG
jgi:hypothetical protein